MKILSREVSTKEKKNYEASLDTLWTIVFGEKQAWYPKYSWDPLAPWNIFCSVNWNLTSKVRFDDVDDINRNKQGNFIPHQRNINSASTNEKHTGISILNAQKSILKKINLISYISHFSHCK